MGFFFSLLVRGINDGIEFTGGSEVQLQFADRPDVGSVRSSLAAAGFSGAVVTTIGDVEDHEVYIRVPLRSEDERADVTTQVVEAHRSDESRQKAAWGLLDLNAANAGDLSSFLLTVEGMTAESAVERPLRNRLHYLLGLGAAYVDRGDAKSGEGVARLGLSMSGGSPQATAHNTLSGDFDGDGRTDLLDWGPAPVSGG